VPPLVQATTLPHTTIASIHAPSAHGQRRVAGAIGSSRECGIECSI
jgi:hypothetical protein